MEKSKKYIFKNSSKTFFYSTLFFPKNIKEDIFTLYAFVRIADDFVDQMPPLKNEFFDFKDKYYDELKNIESNNIIISDFVRLQKKYDFNQLWIDSFFNIMEADLYEVKYKDLKETEKYMYGSAIVIGLMISKILHLKEESYYYAEKLGQAFQYINFIRDIDEDIYLKRNYLPESNFLKYNLTKLDKNYIYKNKDNFEKYLRSEIQYFFILMNEAKKGFHFIKIRYRIPIILASNLYTYTANKIYKDPIIIYKQKVKPNKIRIIIEILKILFYKR